MAPSRLGLLLLLQCAVCCISQTCVGTVAGAVQETRPGVEGSAARGAVISTISPAVADPASPGNIIISRVGNVILVDRAGTITSLAADLAYFPAVFASPGPGRDLFVADAVSIRRIDYDTRRMVVVVGNASAGISFTESSPNGAPALGAAIRVPTCLFVDVKTGDIYFCEGFKNSNVVRVVHAAGPKTGLLATIAGNGSSVRASFGVLATETGFSDIRDISFAPNGDLVVAENDRFIVPRVLRVSAQTGLVSLVAGSIDVFGEVKDFPDAFTDADYFRTGAPALGTHLYSASAVFVHPETGIVYFSDVFRLVAVTPDGTLAVIAGQTPAFKSVTIDGALATSASFSNLVGIRQGEDASQLILTNADQLGAVYFMDLRLGTLRVAAGPVAKTKISPQSIPDGIFATELRVPSRSITGVAIDASTSDLFVSLSTLNSVVRVSAVDGFARVIAGSGKANCPAGGAPDATSVDLAAPYGAALDGKGGLVFAEYACCLILRLDINSGALAVLAGNTSLYCNGPAHLEVPAPDGAIDAPAHYVGQAGSVAVDVLSGDIYWTEDLEQRVVVLRSGALTPVRIAGTGVCYTGSSSSTSDFDGGGPALFTCLGPRNVAVDEIGRPLFITGRFPGTIMRIEPDGILTALAQIPYVDAPGSDGHFGNATAAYLGSLAVVDSGSALLVSDSAQSAGSWSVVRRIDLAAGTITRIAGAFSGPFDDGRTLLDTQFTDIGLIANYPGGNLAIAEVATGRLRIGVVSRSSLHCPAGYSCQCGTPVPCTNPSAYCPAGGVTPVPVSRGCYALAARGNATSFGAYFAAQAPCPVGSYCIDGIRSLCLPGSYGVAPLQSGPAGCAACPLGTFAADAGSVGIGACLPCPKGTVAESPGSSFCVPCPALTRNAITGASSSNACVPCGDAASAVNLSTSVLTGIPASFTGSAQCIALASATLVLADSFATVNLVVEPANSFYNTRPYMVAVLVPIAFIGAFPMLYLMVYRLVFKRGSTSAAKESPRVAALQRFAALWAARFRAFLIRHDFYALRHRTLDGSHPVKLRTSHGGAWTILAIFLICSIAFVLIVQHIFANTILTTTLLPSELPTLLRLQPVSAHTVDRLPAFAPASTLSGFELRVTTAGPSCGAPGFAASSLLAGRFSRASAVEDNVTAAWVHSFACPDCAFGPLSALTITFPPTCQAFAIAATAVGPTGSVSVVSASVSRPPTVESAAGRNGTLSRARVTLEPQLNVVNDSTRGILERGYSIKPTSLSLETAESPTATVLVLDLPVSPVYSLVAVVQITTTVQLLSQLIGLVGLISSCGYLFYLAETYFVRPRRLESALETSRRFIVIRGPDSPGGGGPGSGSKAGTPRSESPMLRHRAPPQVFSDTSHLDVDVDMGIGPPPARGPDVAALQHGQSTARVSSLRPVLQGGRGDPSVPPSQAAVAWAPQGSTAPPGLAATAGLAGDSEAVLATSRSAENEEAAAEVEVKGPRNGSGSGRARGGNRRGGDVQAVALPGAAAEPLPLV